LGIEPSKIGTVFKQRMVLRQKVYALKFLFGDLPEPIKKWAKNVIKED